MHRFIFTRSPAPNGVARFLSTKLSGFKGKHKMAFGTKPPLESPNTNVPNPPTPSTNTNASLATAASVQMEALHNAGVNPSSTSQSPIPPPKPNTNPNAAPKKKKKKKKSLSVTEKTAPARTAHTPMETPKPQPTHVADSEIKGSAKTERTENTKLHSEKANTKVHNERESTKLHKADHAEAVASPEADPKEDPTHRKTAMIKAFRIEDVLNACTADDGVFARRLPQGGCQFFAWPGTPLVAASHAVATMPETIRTVHAIFGRERTPVDLVLDIDCPVPREHWSMSRVRPFQRKALDDVMSVVMTEIAAIGEEVETQVVLQSPNLKKASFHVHTKLKDAAFADYHSLHGFIHRFHTRIPTVDVQIYRSNGMLRMHRCMKENHTSAITVFEGSRWNIGFPNGSVPDAAAALHSACIRPSGTFSRLLRFDAPRVGGVAPNPESNPAGRPLTVLLPRTEREAVECAAHWMRHGSRETDVAEWRTWIGLGISAYRVAYHFRDAQTLQRPAMEELLDAWVEASKKCSVKYKQGVCEAKWASFDIDRLTKSARDDWWPAYQRIGRMAIANGADEKNMKK